MDYYLFIKYYSPLHVSNLKCSSSGGYSCTHAAYGTVTLYESSWWPYAALVYGQFMMYSQKNITLCDAKQVYHYKNIKLKLYKNNTAV